MKASRRARSSSFHMARYVPTVVAMALARTLMSGLLGRIVRWWPLEPHLSITREVIAARSTASYIRDMALGAANQAGPLIREWRLRRSLSQLELASRSAVSGRHLSFIETARARPSREMILHLSQRLDVPLRERNRLLLAGGYAPVFGEHALEEADMTPVREALERFLRAHEPYPAVVVDRHWNIVAANAAVAPLTEGVAPELLEPPANALRVTLHPGGMAPRILNFAEWSSHL